MNAAGCTERGNGTNRWPGGSRRQQSAGRGSGEWRTPACLPFCGVWLAEILSGPGPFKARRSREAAEAGGAALRLARHTAWFCQTTSCSPPPAPQLPGILAMVRVGFSRRWRAVNARVCGAPALFSFVMRRLWGSRGSLPQLLRPEEESCQRIGPQKLSVTPFLSQATTSQVGIQSFCLRSC